MALLEFCLYTPVSKVYTLEATYYPFDSHAKYTTAYYNMPAFESALG
jgi:hypothetical protein